MMENRERIEAGNIELPRTRTSSVPIITIRFWKCIARSVPCHLELRQSNVLDRSGW
jgi:hypothetical protein